MMAVAKDGSRKIRTTMQLKPSALRVDPTYQQPIPAKRVRELARDWDDDLLLPLIVSRREDGAYYVVDGRTRLEAAQVAGKDQDPEFRFSCYVYTGLSIFDEASMYARLGNAVRRKPAGAIWKALLESRDPVVVVTQAEIDASGIGRVDCYATVMDIYRSAGQERFGRVLRLIAGAWQGDRLASGSDMLTACFYCLGAHPTFDPAHAVKHWTEHSAAKVLREADSLNPGRRHSRAFWTYRHLMNLYNVKARAKRIDPLEWPQLTAAIRALQP